MKITVVCDAFGPDNNRTAAAAKALIRSLRKRGHEVSVVCSDEAKAGKEGYLVISRRSIGKRENEKRALENAVWDSDAVHIMTASALGAAAVRLCRQHLIPVSAEFCPQAEGLTARLSPQRIKAANNVYYRRLYMTLYRYADAVRFPSELSRGMFEKAVGHKVNAYVIPHGVDERFRQCGASKPQEWKNRFVIAYCAPFIRGKGHSVLIEAVALSKYSGRIQPVFAGSGPLKSVLKKQGGRLKNRPVMIAYPYSQLPRFYHSADLYVHPARFDADAAACMEAMACGLAPLIADSPYSAACRLAPDSFCLFKSGSAQDLADKIDRIIESPELLLAFREKYRGVGDELTQEACMERVEEMLYDIR